MGQLGGSFNSGDIRHIGAKKYNPTHVQPPAEFQHNTTICPACGQRVNVRMRVPYCNRCLQLSKTAADPKVENRREKDRYVLKEIGDVKKMEEKMSERMEEYRAG